jgi:hypothetical protein
MLVLKYCRYWDTLATWPDIGAFSCISCFYVLWCAPLDILLHCLLALVEVRKSLGHGWSFHNRAIRAMCERHHRFPMPRGASADTPQGRSLWWSWRDHIVWAWASFSDGGFLGGSLLARLNLLICIVMSMFAWSMQFGWWHQWLVPSFSPYSELWFPQPHCLTECLLWDVVLIHTLEGFDRAIVW